MGNRFIVEGQNFRFIVAGTVDCEPSLEGQYPLQDFLLRLFNFTKMNPPPLRKKRKKQSNGEIMPQKNWMWLQPKTRILYLLDLTQNILCFLLKNILRESQFPQIFIIANSGGCSIFPKSLK